jgi:hypothetical protein
MRREQRSQPCWDQPTSSIHPHNGKIVFLKNEEFFEIIIRSRRMKVRKTVRTFEKENLVTGTLRKKPKNIGRRVKFLFYLISISGGLKTWHTDIRNAKEPRHAFKNTVSTS